MLPILFGTLFAQMPCLGSASYSPLYKRGARGISLVPATSKSPLTLLYKNREPGGGAVGKRCAEQESLPLELY